MALRRLVDLKDVLCGAKEDKLAAPRPQKPRPAPLTSDSPRSLRGSSVLVHHMASEELFPSADDIVGQAEAASTACSPSLYSIGGGGAGSSTADERMRQLKLENQALREAFGDTQKRLMELEDERQCFLDEGVYDVVNSICGQTGLSPRENAKCLMGSAENHQKTGSGGTVTYHIGSTDLPAEHPLTFCGSPVATSPMSVAQILQRRSEQDLRSAELSGENDKLRRELERTSKILEVLEQQKHQAEDKMMALEQEHTALLRRLAEVQGGGQLINGLEQREEELDLPRTAENEVEPEVLPVALPVTKAPSRQVSQEEAVRSLRDGREDEPKTPPEAEGMAEAKEGIPEPGGRVLEPWELEDAW